MENNQQCRKARNGLIKYKTDTYWYSTTDCRPHLFVVKCIFVQLDVFI